MILFRLLVGFFLFFHGAHDTREREDQEKPDQDHHDRPELRGGERADELAAVIPAEELNAEAEDAVQNEVQAEIVLIFFLHDQISKESEEQEQERGLVQLRRMHGVRQTREFHPQEGIGLLAVATPGEETADPAECVRNGDTAGDDR